MKRMLAALAASALLLTGGLTASAEDTASLFFTESEAAAVDDGYDSQAHPVVWVFIGGGAAALGLCGWLAFVNREH